MVETVKKQELTGNTGDHRFCVAPMMDWKHAARRALFCAGLEVLMHF
jgi:hypothetical protein